MQIKLVFDAIQHRANRSDFSLSDGPCGFDIDDHGIIGVDQVVGRIGKERRTFARRGPLAGWVGMRCELWLNGGGCTKSRIIKNVEVFAHGTWRIFGGYLSDA